MTDYHADTRVLEEAANAAGIEQLVLYHLVPTPMNSLTETMFLRGLSDKTLLAHDLQVFELPPESVGDHYPLRPLPRSLLSARAFAASLIPAGGKREHAVASFTHYANLASITVRRLLAGQHRLSLPMLAVVLVISAGITPNGWSAKLDQKPHNKHLSMARPGASVELLPEALGSYRWPIATAKP